MPSKSAAQHRLMAAACKGKVKGGPPKKVACEYMHADRGRVAKLPEHAKRKR